jgi:hypothetical protein
MRSARPCPCFPEICAVNLTFTLVSMDTDPLLWSLWRVGAQEAPVSLYFELCLCRARVMRMCGCARTETFTVDLAAASPQPGVPVYTAVQLRFHGSVAKECWQQWCRESDLGRCDPCRTAQGWKKGHEMKDTQRAGELGSAAELGPQPSTG